MNCRLFLLSLAVGLSVVPLGARSRAGAFQISLTGRDVEIDSVVVSDLSGVADDISVCFPDGLKLSPTIAQPFTVNAPCGAFRKGYTVKAFDAAGNAVGFVTSTGMQPKIQSSSVAVAAPVCLPDNGESASAIARGYYKDIFQDAGCALTTYLTLPAATMLGLTFDTMGTSSETCRKFTAEDSVYQHNIVCGNDTDLNGALLYPDNQPRYRMIYMNGGRATRHGRTLTAEGRGNYVTFIANGGSYAGSCAGAFITSQGTVDSDIPEYLALMPTKVKGTNFYGENGMVIHRQSPLLLYHDFGKDMYVDSVLHEGGCFLPEEYLLPEIELLARYDKPGRKLHGHVSIWAYKSDSKSGRVIACGGHPEQVKTGERRDLMASMLQYALDGNGIVDLKGTLTNGEARVMDQQSTAGKPEYARIGDRQYHHFKVIIPEGAKNVKLSLAGDGVHNLELAMQQGRLAWRSDASYLVAGQKGDIELAFDTLKPGVWFVSVYCPDTVSVDCDYQKFEYSGDISVLNGVPYTITASWK